MFSIIDRLANATSKEAVETALYDALRISRSALGGELCKSNEHPVKAYVASEESIKALLNELDKDLIKGLEIVRKIVLRALAM